MYNEAKKASNAKYLSRFKPVSLRIDPDEAEQIKKAADTAGESMSKYIMNACRERMTGKYECMPHESDMEALPDLLTPYARQLADDASKAAGVEVTSWIERTLAARAAAEADGRRFIKEANERIGKK
jgi:uncharacterized protein (DUF1778 family)